VSDWRVDVQEKKSSNGSRTRPVFQGRLSSWVDDNGKKERGVAIREIKGIRGAPFRRVYFIEEE